MSPGLLLLVRIGVVFALLFGSILAADQWRDTDNLAKPFMVIISIIGSAVVYAGTVGLGLVIWLAFK